MKAKQIALAVLLGLMVGCGGSQKPKAGPLPEGATFYGVWQSPQYGSMHLCQSGRQVVGDYVKNERAGRIQGDIDGDLLVFQWEDRRELVLSLGFSLVDLSDFFLSFGSSLSI